MEYDRWPKGAERSARQPIVIEARRLEPGAAVHGDFTFEVLEAPRSSQKSSADRRGSPRQRTRLRSGKLVDAAGRFLTECLLHDLSPRGVRLKLPPGITLPRLLQIYDDQTGTVHQATVLWRRDRDAGVAFGPVVNDNRSRAVAAEMKRKFYAVRD